MDEKIEELRRSGLIAVLELRTLGDTELDQLLRPHRIRQIEGIIDALTQCAETSGAPTEWMDAAHSAVAEIRWALAQCLDHLARAARAAAGKMSA